MDGIYKNSISKALEQTDDALLALEGRYQILLAKNDQYVKNFWSDSPINNSDDDRLGRERIAKRLFDFISKMELGTESAVFAINAPWGAGKTSLLNLIQNEFCSRKLETDWKVVKFTPWAAGDQAKLLEEFYNCLASALPERKYKKLKKRFKVLISLSIPLVDSIPTFGKFLSNLATISIRDRLHDKTWDSLFNSIANELKENDRHILVFADDVDRLDISELSTLLKLIRLLGKLPNVHYLLCYDEEALTSTLSSGMFNTIEEAKLFLEKFVQYPVQLPEIMPYEIWFLLKEQLNLIFPRSKYAFDIDNSKLASCRSEIVFKLSTPRAVGRLAATLRYLAPLYQPGEIVVDDLILITIIALTNKPLYRMLHASRQLLCGEGEVRGDQTMLQERIVTLASEASLINITQRLFPRLLNASSLVAAGPSIANQKHFYRYFYHGITNNDAVELRIISSIKDMEIGCHDIADMFLGLSDDGKLLKIYLNKVEDLVTSSDPEIRKLVCSFGAFKYFVLRLQDHFDAPLDSKNEFRKGKIENICRALWISIQSGDAAKNNIHDKLSKFFDELNVPFACYMFEVVMEEVAYHNVDKFEFEECRVFGKQIGRRLCQNVLKELMELSRLKYGTESDLSVSDYRLEFLHKWYSKLTDEKIYFNQSVRVDGKYAEPFIHINYTLNGGESTYFLRLQTGKRYVR